MLRTSPYHTEILAWRGERPVIAVGRYTDRSVYWFCDQCKSFHYHYPTDGVVRRCVKGDYRIQGHYIKVVEG